MREAEHLSEAVVPDNELAPRIEHAEPMCHVPERRLEATVLQPQSVGDGLQLVGDATKLAMGANQKTVVPGEKRDKGDTTQDQPDRNARIEKMKTPESHLIQRIELVAELSCP